MILTFLGILLFTGILAWWLSGYDTKLTWEDKQADFIRRAVRCGITLLLVALAAWGLLHWGMTGGWMFLAITVPIGIVWAGCLSELAARGFHGLVDTEDRRAFDPKQTTRDLDRLAELVRSGRREEAIEFCQVLRESGEVSVLALDAILHRLSSPEPGGGISSAAALAEGVESLLVGTQTGTAAPAVIDPGAASVEELLAGGHLATAIERLESQIRERPRDFELRLQLAEAYAVHCVNLRRAAKIVENIERDSAFSADQIQVAKTRLKEWKAGRGSP